MTPRPKFLGNPAPKTATAMPVETSTAAHQLLGTTPEDRIHTMHLHKSPPAKSRQNQRSIITAAILFVTGVILGIIIAAWYSRAGVITSAEFGKFLVCLCLVLSYLVYDHLAATGATK